MGSMLFFTAAIFLVGAATVAQNAPECNRPNETKMCVKECPPERTCRNRDIQYRCAEDNKKCTIKCICKAGYYRSYLGDCVIKEVCEKCPGDHEFFDCGGECDNECSTIRTQNRTNCPYVNIQCNKKCYCEDGFARSGGKCVPVSQCKTSWRQRREVSQNSKKTRRPNEEYVMSKPYCPPEYCISLVAKFKCAAKQPHVPGWACKSGYLRLEEGAECRPIKECPQLANRPDVQ